jgi:hypothetical protein
MIDDSTSLARMAVRPEPPLRAPRDCIIILINSTSMLSQFISYQSARETKPPAALPEMRLETHPVNGPVMYPMGNQ